MDAALDAVELHRGVLAKRFRLALRIDDRGQLIESRFRSVERLLLIADQIKANPIEKGWSEAANSRYSPRPWRLPEPTHTYRVREYIDLLNQTAKRFRSAVATALRFARVPHLATTPTTQATLEQG